MHKILVATELPRLRQLGYEVFNPPYLSPVLDQSAELNWNPQQGSTLPTEIFERLSKYNFFYNSIEPEIAEILNQYFDAVVVTIHPGWLTEILKVYPKKVLYRAYGQTEVLSVALKQLGAFDLIVNRENFFFLPHSAETLKDEHSWLAQRASIVPYALTDDIFLAKDTYDLDVPKSHEIMLTAPNIDNPSFREHYKKMKADFSNPLFKFYGVQLRKVNDPQVVGTLSRESLIQHFQNSSGYLYTFKNPRVCYLPPIEMMVVGGPVVFLQGSLLDRMSAPRSPARAKNESHAVKLCELLAQGDKALAQEVIASQQEVRKLYSPEWVWPIFDKVMTSLLNQNSVEKLRPISFTPSLPIGGDKKKNVYILMHFEDQPIEFSGGYYAVNASFNARLQTIPGSMRAIIESLKNDPKLQFIITCRREQIEYYHGFFMRDPQIHKIQFLIIDDQLNKNYLFFRIFEKISDRLKARRKLKNQRVINGGLLPSPSRTAVLSHEANFNRQMFKIISLKMSFVSNFYFLCLIFNKASGLILKKILTATKQLKSSFRSFLLNAMAFFQLQYQSLRQIAEKNLCIDQMNKDENCHSVIVPHYYLFPEALQLKKDLNLYLPEYLPHFFEETGEIKNDPESWSIGHMLGQQAKSIITNSRFSKNYLSQSKLAIPPEKIDVCYFPFEIESEPLSQLLLDSSEIEKIKSLLEKRDFIFCPIQLTIKQNLEFLLQIFSEVKVIYTDLKLIIYSSDDFVRISDPDIVFLTQLESETLSWIYKNARTVALTSLVEDESWVEFSAAWSLDSPIVAIELESLNERLGEARNKFLLAKPYDQMDFMKKLNQCLQNREKTIENQRLAKTQIQKQWTSTELKKSILKALRLDL